MTLAQVREVFERSPWVAERAWKRGPFASKDALHAAMMAVVREASHEEQLALIRAHPELAGAEAAAGRMTAASTGEQGRLGFDRLSAAEFAAMKDLNARYSKKHGFPCIVALRLHATKEGVMAEMGKRAGNDTEAEFRAALEQIGHIARGRLDKLA